MARPPMNADKRRLKTKNLSAFICVYPRPICLFQQPANALFEPDTEKGGFVVTFPDFKWGVTQDDTEQQAVEMAVDALEMIVRDYMERGKPIPNPSKVRGRKCRVIRLPGLQSVKVELFNAFLASGMRKAGLARRLKIPSPNIDRLFSLDHQSRLDQLEAAFSALGKQLNIEIRDAA
jgi:antitoxin HicB